MFLRVFQDGGFNNFMLAVEPFYKGLARKKNVFENHFGLVSVINIIYASVRYQRFVQSLTNELGAVYCLERDVLYFGINQGVIEHEQMASDTREFFV